MKLSEKSSLRISKILVWLVPAILMVPNVALSIQGHMGLLASFANFLLPAGVFLFMMTWRNRVGTNVLLLVPFMVLAAFQIVLLFLYADGSIIGVDMFLNVATSNPSEAMELLDNLRPAIITVVALYLPAIMLAIVAMRGKVRTGAVTTGRARMSAMALCVSGGVVLGCCVLTDPYYHVDEAFYPVNVLANLGSAFKRSFDSGHYHETSASHSYHARSTRPGNRREVYVAVIGETSRADNWQILGYNRFTTPRLSSLPAGKVAAFRNALSESNTTHKSVPLLLSTLSSEDFADSLNSSRSIITAFKEAGYNTAYITTQCRNGSYIDYFAAEADTTMYIREPEPGNICLDVYDVDMLAPLDSLLALEPTKLFVVLHQYGSHFNYVDRYPREAAFFLPDKASEAAADNRGRLINAYDNSIRQTDELLCSIIERLDSIGCDGGMIYTSDHGEDIFDDARGRFLHASPTPTYFQLHVPMLVYVTPSLGSRRPDLVNQARIHRDCRVSSSASFSPTILHLAGIDTPLLDLGEALTSSKFREVERRCFLSDRNRARSLNEAGFAAEDFARLERLEHTRYISERVSHSNSASLSSSLRAE